MWSQSILKSDILEFAIKSSYAVSAVKLSNLTIL